LLLIVLASAGCSTTIAVQKPVSGGLIGALMDASYAHPR
jgi:hypothetical protein